MCCRRSGLARWGHLTRAQPGLRRVRSERLGSGVERPYSAGIRSERVEALGAAGRTTWTPVVGLADETSGRQIALRYTSRSLVSATAVHHRGSRWRRAGRRWGGTSLLRSRGSAQETAEPWKLSPWKEHDEGVKIIPAQNSAGVDTRYGLQCGKTVRVGQAVGGIAAMSGQAGPESP